MKKNLKFVFALCVLVVAASLVTDAQLQQSGGSGSTINTFLGLTTAGQQTMANSMPVVIASNQSNLPTNLAQVGGSSVALGQTTMSASIPVAIASNQGAVPASESGSWTVGVNAGTNLIGYTRAQNGCGTTNYESALAYVPTSLTSLTATTTCVSYVIFNNVTSSAVTITMQDQTTNCNSAACQIFSSFSLPGNSSVMLPLAGVKFTSGIKWQAGTANALVADVVGNQ